MILVITLATFGAALGWASRTGKRDSPTPAQPLADFTPHDLHASSPEDDDVRLALPELGRTRDAFAAVPAHDDARCTTRTDESVLAASIRDESGVHIADARLVVFTLVDDAPRLLGAVEAKCSGDSYACVRSAADGDVLVAAFAPGFVPMARRVTNAIGERLDVEPFVLKRGESITGRVRIGREALARAEVEAVACSACDVLELGYLPIAWRYDRFVWVKPYAETALDGSYTIRGLEPGEYKVRLRTVRHKDVAVDVSKALPVRIEAPAENVDFELPAARLELLFQSESNPVCCMDVQIEAGDRQFTRTTGDDGRLSILIQPALAYPIIATRRGYETRRTQVRGMIDGERVAHTIQVDPQKVFATVHIDDSGDAGVNEATFVFQPRWPLMHGSAFERTVRREVTTGEFLIPDVPSGAWMVTMRSGRGIKVTSSAEGRSLLSLRSNCDSEFALAVPDTGSVKARVAVKKRGAVRLVVRDENGRRIQAHGKLVDAHGGELDAALIKSEDNIRFGGPFADNTDDPTFVYPLACEGPFELLVYEDGYEMERVKLQLQPGSVTSLDVRLRAR
ncbi:MAG: carboxypeptidase regulatory-like domain-containing protein [Planctomycetes bacterium]|nr:carboxypeptidase regulatory-like domain-containing protein [Planctomycetota bacterium]